MKIKSLTTYNLHRPTFYNAGGFKYSHLLFLRYQINSNLRRTLFKCFHWQIRYIAWYLIPHQLLLGLLVNVLYCCSRFEVYLFPTAKERKALLHQKYTLSIPFKLCLEHVECTAIHAVQKGYTGSILIISNC